MLFGVVYKATCAISGKSYIGITKQRLQRRWRAHVQRSVNQDRGCRAIATAIQKYGAEAFSVEAIASAVCEIDLLSLEQLLIAQEKTLSPNGYNLHEGGKGTLNPTPETRDRMRRAHLGKKQSPEWIAKRTAGQTGRKMPRDAVERSAAKQRGQKRAPATQERKDKARAELTGLKRSRAEIEKSATARRGIKRGPMTAQHRAAIKNGHARRKAAGRRFRKRGGSDQRQLSLHL